MNQNDRQAPEVVFAFQKDVDELGIVDDQKGWYVTDQWANEFQDHLKALLPLAESGDISAQYSVAAIYICGYLYRSEEEMAENHESDQRELTMWLEKAARGGHWGAIDNLLVLGVGEETERLRKLYKENIELFEKAPPPSPDWEKSIKTLYEIAYGGS